MNVSNSDEDRKLVEHSLAKNSNKLSVLAMSCSKKWILPIFLMLNVMPTFHGSTRIISTRSIVPHISRFNHFAMSSLSLPISCSTYHLVVDITNIARRNAVSGSVFVASVYVKPLINHLKCSLLSSKRVVYRYNFKRWSVLLKSSYENLYGSHGGGFCLTGLYPGRRISFVVLKMFAVDMRKF